MSSTIGPFYSTPRKCLTSLFGTLASMRIRSWDYYAVGRSADLLVPPANGLPSRPQAQHQGSLPHEMSRSYLTKAAGEAGKKTVDYISDNAKDYAKDQLDDAKDAAKDYAKEQLDDAKDAMKDYANEQIDAVKDAAMDAAQEQIDAAKEQIGAVRDQAQAAIDAQKQAAEDEIDARKQQAQDEINAEKQKAQAAFDDAKDNFFKNLFGCCSICYHHYYCTRFLHILP
ncbi:hypothetical protein GGX14DRAFT_696366, partial [Mycena pura]